MKWAFLAHLACVEESDVSCAFHPALSLSYLLQCSSKMWSPSHLKCLHSGQG